MLGKTKKGSHKEQNRGSQCTGISRKCCKQRCEAESPPQTQGWCTTPGPFPWQGFPGLSWDSLLWDSLLLPTHPTLLQMSEESLQRMGGFQTHSRTLKPRVSQRKPTQKALYQKQKSRGCESITPRVQRAKWDLQPNHYTFAPPQT